MTKSRIFGATLALAAIAACAAPARAADNFSLTIKGKAFDPNEFTVPAGKKVTLTVKNLNPTPSEFESFDLNREKVVTGGSDITLFVGPLRPGSYEFFDDFSADTPHGHIVAK
ncbi:MAG TPA: cupredoxin domain-containing protein [Stellaceae bacterium]|nr:cupredoxin domain-containing protein [Stellaceae bacterium]